MKKAVGGDLSPSPSTTWSFEEDKLFEAAIVDISEGTPDRWPKIAGKVPGKTPAEAREHYDALVQDVLAIESGLVELPTYTDDSFIPSRFTECRTSQISFGSSKAKQTETEKKKGLPWTEEEHRNFLVGLETYGRGDWRSISRNCVKTRTPTQVASHAQKYFLRLNSAKKGKKRSSIYDITTVENSPVVVQPPNDQRWIEQSGGPVPQAMESIDPTGGPGQKAMGTIDPTRFFPSQGGSLEYQGFGFPA